MHPASFNASSKTVQALLDSVFSPKKSSRFAYLDLAIRQKKSSPL